MQDVDQADAAAIDDLKDGFGGGGDRRGGGAVSSRRPLLVGLSSEGEGEMGGQQAVEEGRLAGAECSGGGGAEEWRDSLRSSLVIQAVAFAAD